MLPADTLAVITVPDVAEARRLYHQSPQTRFWSDPALQPFVDKFWKKFDAEVLKPFEEKTGTSLTNLLDLAQGQCTLALTRNGWPAQPGASPGLVLLLDTRNRAPRLKELLANVRDKVASGGTPVKTASLDGTEFLVLSPPTPKSAKSDDSQSPDAQGGESEPEAGAKQPVREFLIGQSGTMLICGSSRLDLQKILTLKRGGAVLALAESTSFMPDYKAMFQDATAYVWINTEPVFNMASQALLDAGATLPMGMNPGRILTSLGLGGLQTVSLAGKVQSEGVVSQMKIRVPEDARRGLFRMLEFEAKDSAPPSYVPADALTFTRTRIDLARAWNTLESTITEISPQLGGVVRMTVDSIGKDKDSMFDFRKQFVANLGDDVMTWQVAPKPGAVAVGPNPPEVALISSPKPDELASAMKLLMGMIPPDVAKLEESELAGTKVWSIKIPMGLPNSGQGAPPTQTIAFAAAKGYLALATDLDLLKNYLEGRPGPAGALVSGPALRVAADKAGGFDTGLFGYSNDRENIRTVWTAMTNPGAAGANPTALMWHQLLTAAAASGKGGDLNEWIDFSLLPPFEKVQKYFYFTVYAGSVGRDGFTLKSFAPIPPDL